MGIEVTQVKCRDGKTTVLGQEPNGAHKADVGLRDCPDKRKPAFTAALAAVNEDITKLTGLSHVEVYGVHVDTDRHGHHGFIFDIEITAPWGTSFATLARIREPSSGETGPGVLPDTVFRHVTTLLSAAAAYYAQDREQLDLGLDDAKAAGAPEGEAAAGS